VVGLTANATDQHMDVVRAMYRAIEAPLVVTDAESAELIKNAANAFLATKITFANEIARLCHATGANVDSVIAGVAADPRIGSEFLRAGLGYGGSCLPKDVRSLISMGRDHGLTMGLAEAVDGLNAEQPEAYAVLLRTALDGLADRRIAILGLSFKPETDDIRDSPALALARSLRVAGASVVGCDPVALERVRTAEPWLELADSAIQAARGADAVVLATEWPAYVTIDPAALAAEMSGKVYVDARNALDPGSVRAAGLHYLALGRR
jgi:UDPglucose 6-dehydrogenase